MHKHINIEECCFDGKSRYQRFSSSLPKKTLVIKTQILKNDDQTMAWFYSLDIIKSARKSFLLMHACLLQVWESHWISMTMCKVVAQWSWELGPAFPVAAGLCWVPPLGCASVLMWCKGRTGKSGLSYVRETCVQITLHSPQPEETPFTQPWSAILIHVVILKYYW